MYSVISTKLFKRFEQFLVLPQILQWLLIASVVGVLSGLGSALLLASLEWATRLRESHLWMIALLPIGGFLIGWIYHLIGKDVEAGNNLLLDEIHDPKKIIQLRMAPLVLIGTVATHLFGGSAGREGTALQMGGSFADQLSQPLRLSPENRRILLMAGISGGFASVFGTPLAGAFFGLEVLAIGKMRYDAIFPCFIAALIGNQVTLACGISHAAYIIPEVPHLTMSGLLISIIAGAAFGIVGMLFAKAIHQISKTYKTYIKYAPLRPLIGGAMVAILVWVMGTTKYIGLGIPTMVDSFSRKLPPWDFGGKFFMTILTLGAGFKGGEVTPLFYIGATLGNALSYVLALPTPLLAGMGFVAVFAGAANTPLASTLMAIELFGSHAGIYAGMACVASYLFSGHAGIYHSQRIGLGKATAGSPIEGLSLSALVQARKVPVVHLVQDLHFLGFIQKKEVFSMSYPMTVLRLYFHYGARTRKQGFFAKFRAPSLGTDLLTKAKDFGIEQVILHRVSAGFLKGDILRKDIFEVPPDRLPQCIELIDQEEKLRLFLETYPLSPEEVRVVLLRAENPLLDLKQGER